MTAREEGFLLLTSHLGNPERRPLTVAQFRNLTRRARQMEKPTQERDITEEDLLQIGCDRSFARRVMELLSQQQQLRWYLDRGRKYDCYPVTRLNPFYPSQVRRLLDIEAPGCLWIKGDLSVLNKPMVALVGSRDLAAENQKFAMELGKQAALQGYTLVSGNARGADRTAQESCLESGGTVISIIADELINCPLRKGVLYFSEEDFDQAFSAQRALSRNRIIHILGKKTFVAQCDLNRGGTWDGSIKNLQNGWSSVFCFDDGSVSARELILRGAVPVSIERLSCIENLQNDIIRLI